MNMYILGGNWAAHEEGTFEASECRKEIKRSKQARSIVCATTCRETIDNSLDTWMTLCNARVGQNGAKINAKCTDWASKTDSKSLPRRSGAPSERLGASRGAPGTRRGRSGDPSGTHRDAVGTLWDAPRRSWDVPGTLQEASGPSRSDPETLPECCSSVFNAPMPVRTAVGACFDRFSHVVRKRASAFRLSFSGVSCKSSKR